MLFSTVEEQSSILSVSELNTEIKSLLESNYPFVWVRGEISNWRAPASGHCYFTLKDQKSQIRSVLFRTQQRSLRFAPEDGLMVLCLGRLSVYEPRGEYQIIVERMEPEGLGALQLAFEQLKKKLAAEGLFDESLKKPLPLYPQRIAIVTSPTGAAIRDVLKGLQRSPYPVSVALLPVRVQGQEAGIEIASALATVNQMAPRFGWDLVIVGRGGGSIEDLWPFNEELVARAMASCSIPTISAVGHEIDFTIADFVSDLRVSTPTAAAQWIVARLEGLQRELLTLRDRTAQAMIRHIEGQRQATALLEKRLVDPKKRLQDLRLFVDDRLERLELGFRRTIERLRDRHAHLSEKLWFFLPLKIVQRYKVLLDQHARELALHARKIVDGHRFDLQHNASRLDSLSPLAVLARGYSIATRLPDQAVLRSAAQVDPGDRIRVRLSEGALECIVERTHVKLQQKDEDYRVQEEK